MLPKLSHTFCALEVLAVATNAPFLISSHSERGFSLRRSLISFPAFALLFRSFCRPSTAFRSPSFFPSASPISIRLRNADPTSELPPSPSLPLVVPNARHGRRRRDCHVVLAGYALRERERETEGRRRRPRRMCSETTVSLFSSFHRVD